MMGMESAVRLAVGLIHVLAWLTWAGALGVIGYRVYQMNRLPSVEAKVLDAETVEYTSTSYRKDATNWTAETRSQMYVPTAVVRYRYQGRDITARAQHDVGFSWRWVQDRATRDWRRGSLIRIYIKPAKPEEPLAGLGMNLSTFLPAVMLGGFGGVLMGCGWALVRIAAAVSRFAGS